MTIKRIEKGRMVGGGIHDGGFSSNGKFMVTAGNDSTVKVWDLVAMKEARSVEPFGGYS